MSHVILGTEVELRSLTAVFGAINFSGGRWIDAEVNPIFPLVVQRFLGNLMVVHIFFLSPVRFASQQNRSASSVRCPVSRRQALRYLASEKVYEIQIGVAIRTS